MDTSAKINITLPNGTIVTTSATPNTKLGELLAAVGITDITRLTVYNSGETPMPYMDYTMTDYNNWYVEKGHIPSLYVRPSMT